MRPGPTAVVIFGATGDLSRTKLLPALYNLAHDESLPDGFHVIGISRSLQTDDALRSVIATAVRDHSRRKPDESVLSALLGSARAVAGAATERRLFEDLHAVLDDLDARTGQPLTRVFYLSTAPDLFSPIVETLAELDIHRRLCAEARVVVEKPFGSSLAQAAKLNRHLLANFAERHIFRVDHYLGKETVQNVLAFRFANTLFEPVWNSNYIDHVQITAAEDVGVKARAGYYEHAGALRDLVQNHLLQVLCLLCMEPPVDFSPEAVRNEKVKALRAVTLPPRNGIDSVAVRGQYAHGSIGGTKVPGYLDEPGVDEGSSTETYAALRLELHNWRWSGVPFYLRTGKRLPRKTTEIAVQLKPVPHLALRREWSSGIKPNQLVIRLQPDEGVSLVLGAKAPGDRMVIQPVEMDFRYSASFQSEPTDAYERLILDALRGDPTLFTREDEVEEQWRICDPIVCYWRDCPAPPARYPAGSQGPEAATRVLANGHRWRPI
jgi:glucose-6-phosphate 1-dehydrogenase